MFNNRVAVITGGTRGIGLATAKKLAANGCDIAVISTSCSPSVEKEVANFGVKCISYACDVSDAEKADAAARQIITDFGKVDILVNNAGICSDKLLIAMAEEDFDRVISVNLKGTYLMTKAFLRHFMKNRYGRIVNISSVAGLAGNAGQANYAASKAGVIGFTKSVAKEYASKGITCNAVAPGFIDTDMTKGLTEEARAKIAQSVPAGCIGKAEDAARAVCFLASDASGYITGEVIKVDGGLYI
ncbi:MAG: 3-oxoacyl-[acyl-carrier-protein] reductase [Clostridia bacterium]|nr:3-oxoacyl-[acyl-carrier-protein] reductase [Clostridia bacterium]